MCQSSSAIDSYLVLWPLLSCGKNVSYYRANADIFDITKPALDLGPSNST